MDWQNLIVLLMVALAASWICYRSWRSLQSSRSDCGASCGSCAHQRTAPGASSSPPMVSLDSLHNSARVMDPSSPVRGVRHS